MSWCLALDFGSTFSTAATVTEDRVTVLDVFGSRRLPSVVLLEEGGQLVVGGSAESAAAFMPDRVERAPKRAVGNRMLLLGGEPVLVVDVVAALLAVLVDEAVRQHGGNPPERTLLTHPARWGPERLTALTEAAIKAGIDGSTLELVPEPVAAAALYSKARALQGDAVAVYDLGGGTFDSAVLRTTPDGFEVAGAPQGDETIGGEAFDHLLYRKVGEHVAATDASLWVDLTTSPDRRWRRANTDLLAQVRMAKETLSTSERANVYVPDADRVISITRSEFEGLVLDDIERTAEILARTVEGAGLQTAELAAVYLVGGSSRIPLVGRLLTDHFTDRLSTWDDPQLAVVLGAAELLRSGFAMPAAPSEPDSLLPDAEHGEPTAPTARIAPIAVADEPPSEPPEVAAPIDPLSAAGSSDPEALERVTPPPDLRRRAALAILGAAALITLVVVAVATRSEAPQETATTSPTDGSTVPVSGVGSLQWQAMIRDLTLCDALASDDDLPSIIRSTRAAEGCENDTLGVEDLLLCDAIYDYRGELRTTESGESTDAAIVDTCPPPSEPGSEAWQAKVRDVSLCEAIVRDELPLFAHSEQAAEGCGNATLGVEDLLLCDAIYDHRGELRLIESISSSTDTDIVEACPTPPAPGSDAWEAKVRDLSLCEAIVRDELPVFFRPNASADACADGDAGAEDLSLCDAIYEDDGSLMVGDDGETTDDDIVDACTQGLRDLPENRLP